MQVPVPETEAPAGGGIPTQPSGGQRWARAFNGALLAGLGGYVLGQMTFLQKNPQEFAALAAVAGALLGLTRARRIVLAFATFAILAALVVGNTPLVPWLLSEESRPFPPPPQAEVVVALGGGSYEDGALSSLSQERVLHAFELMHGGYARRLVLPGPASVWEPRVRDRMRALGLDYPVEEVGGPMANTHDEAMAIAQLARQRGWRRVILVTNAWHMRRAIATFRKCGLDVSPAPCEDSTISAGRHTDFIYRLTAMNYLLHEAVGYELYRLRRWV